MKVSISCAGCGGEIRPTDEFCESCGVRVTDDQKLALSERLEASNHEMAQHMKHVRSARQAIMLLAVLFVLGGVVMFFMAKGNSDEALRSLRDLPSDTVLPEPINGKMLTVAETRRMVENEPLQVLGLNLFLAALMAGLWVWGKKATLAAILVALAVFVTVHAGSALVDPKTLVQGLAVKIFAIVVLTRGVRAALAARKTEQTHRA
jgi:cytochrome bd-type quinol oxidase subunit 2